MRVGELISVVDLTLSHYFSRHNGQGQVDLTTFNRYLPPSP